VKTACCSIERDAALAGAVDAAASSRKMPEIFDYSGHAI
jgi:hypothetical protein